MITPLTYGNIEDVLTRCFLEYWNDRTPVVLKNALQRQMPDDVQAWVYFTVQRTANRQDSMGMYPRITRIGRIFAEVFVTSGLVTGLQNKYLDDIVHYYEAHNHSPLRIQFIEQIDLPDGAHRRASITGDGRWFGTQVSVRWAFDEINKGEERYGSCEHQFNQPSGNPGDNSGTAPGERRSRVSGTQRNKLIRS